MGNKIFGNFDEMKTVEITNPPMIRQIFYGDKLLIGKNVIKAGTIVPEHSHEHEQMTYILSGVCDVIVNGGAEVRRCGAGEIAVFKANVSHEIRCVGRQDVHLFDIFAPVREDWIKDFV